MVTSTEASKATVNADNDLADVLNKSETVSVGVTTVNAQMEILQKKISGTVKTLTEVSELIENTLDKVDDDAISDVLFDIADEISDMQEMMKREALVSLQTSVKGMNSSSQDLAAQAGLLAEASKKLNTAKGLNVESSQAGQKIHDVSTAFRGGLGKTSARHHCPDERRCCLCRNNRGGRPDATDGSTNE